MLKMRIYLTLVPKLIAILGLLCFMNLAKANGLGAQQNTTLEAVRLSLWVDGAKGQVPIIAGVYMDEALEHFEKRTKYDSKRSWVIDRLNQVEEF